MTECTFNPEVCALKHEIIDHDIDSIKEEQKGIRDDIREVRNLQKQILYAIMSVGGISLCILVGVVTGRAIDFRFLLP